MNPTTQTQQVSPSMAALFKVLKYIEMIGLAMTAVGLLMMYVTMEGAFEILMISMSILSAVYFLKGNQPPAAPAQVEGAPKGDFFDLLVLKIIPKAGWIGCSVAVVGLLFTFLGLKGSTEMLMIGCMSLAVVLFLIVVLVVQKQDRMTSILPLLYRAVPLGLLSGYFFMKAMPLS